MSDIFREVEEDVRRERLEKLWKAYGNYFIALAALIVLGAAGYVGWQRYEAARRDKASVAFVAAQHITTPIQAAQAFAALAQTAPGGYAALSRLQQANALLAAGRQGDAVALYRQIADSDNGAVGAVARLRAAWALADTATRADLNALLQPLETPNGVWRQMAAEILAYVDYRTHNLTAATAEFKALAGDTEAPDLLRERARAFAAFLESGGDTSFGTVPPPAPIPPQSAMPAPPSAPGAPAASPGAAP